MSCKESAFPRASAKAQHACNSSLLQLPQNTNPTAKEDGIMSFSDCTNAQTVQTCTTYLDAPSLVCKQSKDTPCTICRKILTINPKIIKHQNHLHFKNLQIYSLPKTGLSPDFLHQIACSRLGLAFHQTAPWAQGDDHVLCHGTCLTNNHETTMAGDGRSFENHMESHG